MLHQKKKVQQESLKAYMAAELNFWYKTPAIILFISRRKTLSLSKFWSTGSPCHSLTPVIVSSLKEERKLSLSIFFLKCRVVEAYGPLLSGLNIL